MTSFESFWASLNDNYQWVEWMERIARTEQKSLKRAAETAYGNYIAEADGTIDPFTKYPIQEQRKYVGNILKNQKPEAFKPVLQQPEVKPIEGEKKWQPTTPERRERWLKVFAWRVSKANNNFVVPKISTRQAMEEGGWTPKKDQPYKSDDDIFLIRLKENVRRFAARRYKSLYSWSGFSNFDLGLIQIYAQNSTDAQHFYKCAERLTRMQLNVKKKKRVNLV